jgi:thymidylate synthase (FAD)
MTITFYGESKNTLIGRPQFIIPEHLPMHQIGESTDGEELAEFAGRLCYQSHNNPAERTTHEYLANIKAQGHGSVLEHVYYSILVEQVSRTFTHELVRHRAGMAYSQVSQRFVDSSDVGFVMPPLIQASSVFVRTDWQKAMGDSLVQYEKLADFLALQLREQEPLMAATLRRKRAREAARSVLPNATETKIVVTGNVRAWRHILVMRGAEGADMEIRAWAKSILTLLTTEAPGFFEDMTVLNGSIDTPYIKV